MGLRYYTTGDVSEQEKAMYFLFMGQTLFFSCILDCLNPKQMLKAWWDGSDHITFPCNDRFIRMNKIATILKKKIIEKNNI